MEVKEWSEKGKMISVLNTDVFVIDEGKGENTLFILHGYATSSIDYYKVLPKLTKQYRVVLMDLIGFGFSDKPKDHHYSIIDQADIILELWRILELKNIILLGHNFGTVIALEILSRKEKSFIDIDIQKLIFLNSTVAFNQEYSDEEGVEPLEEFSNKIKLMFTSFSFFKTKMQDFFFDASKFSDEEIKAIWVLNDHKNGREVIDFLPNYISECKLLWNRWFTAIENNNLPCKIISGKNDAIFSEIEAINFAKEFTNSKLHFIENCGHYPMLEKPKKLIEFILN